VIERHGRQQHPTRCQAIRNHRHSQVLLAEQQGANPQAVDMEIEMRSQATPMMFQE